MKRPFAAIVEGAYQTSTGAASHFRTEELTCRCGCGAHMADEGLIDLLETIRGHLGAPVFVNSGVRCIYWNTRVGGVQSSQHLPRTMGGGIVRARGTLLGATRAADITTKSLSPRQLQAMLARKRDEWGIMGLGSYPGFTHVDVRTGPRATWKG